MSVIVSISVGLLLTTLGLVYVSSRLENGFLRLFGFLAGVLSLVLASNFALVISGDEGASASVQNSFQNLFELFIWVLVVCLGLFLLSTLWEAFLLGKQAFKDPMGYKTDKDGYDE